MNYPKGLSVIDHEGKLLVKLYDTMILVLDRSTGHVKLDSGLTAIGRMSKHTKKCLNMVLADMGYQVKQKDFQWTVLSQDSAYKFDSQGRCEFKL